MRIDSNFPLQRGTETEKSNKSSSAGKFRSSQVDDKSALGEDSVSLSSLASKALESPEVRQDKVDNLRQAIANGTYSVDPKQTADAMIFDASA